MGEGKPVRIYDVKVVVGNKEIGVKEISLDLRMPGAKKSLDTATFLTHTDITLGSTVVVWMKDQPLFEGVIDHIGIAKGKDGLIDITATCSAS